VGWVSVKLINRIHLVASGLYPVMVAACGFLSFGIAANLGGSGFLAIFLTGVVIGNRRIAFQRSIFLFHDGLAWLSQIAMFVVLGLLINPMSLLEVWWEGLAIAAVLILVARPLAVVPLLKLFGFNAREMTLVSWVGLRGSVPIILAIFPLLFGLESAPLIFNVVFFVVLISASIQGTTLPLVARKLKLTESPPAVPAATLEITALEEVDADIVEYRLGDQPRAAGRRLSQMALPESTVVAMITRGSNVIPPRGSTLLQANDHLFVVLRPETRPFIDCVFSDAPEAALKELPDQALKLKGSTTLDDLHHAYGLQTFEQAHMTLDQLLRERLDGPLEVGDTLTLGSVTFGVEGLLGERVTTVSLTLDNATG
ncbi:potassium/proton antiporter, partial [Halomonas sp. 707D4]